MKRELGNGRWDRILKKRLIERSIADNYDDAKEEWIATGDVWWSGSYDIPDWVSDSPHQNYCLCGHGIVYHFRIRNTENGLEEIVGSDHINSYLIMRQIAEEKKVNVAEVTDEQVEIWLKERVGSMKAEAWWAENGDAFTMMFDAVKEVDVWHNVHLKDYVYDSSRRQYYHRRVLRKKGKGEFGLNYEMASIVWRWNHPDNPKAQIKTNGFPNEKLMMDLSLFFTLCQTGLKKEHEDWMALRQKRLEQEEQRQEQIRVRREKEAQERKEREERERIEWEAGREERERKARIEQKKREAAQREKQRQKQLKAVEFLSEPKSGAFENMCGFYGIPVFDASTTSNVTDQIYLARIKGVLLGKKPELSRAVLEKLKEIFTGE
jgi:hypothetical protein